ncbi:MAG: EAL domain-containing protein, partial [Pseudomonadota bacterium]
MEEGRGACAVADVGARTEQRSKLVGGDGFAKQETLNFIATQSREALELCLGFNALDTVKIDRAFISDITTSDEDQSICAAIIAMAHGLNLSVVAEGVETEAQLKCLARLGCDE